MRPQTRLHYYQCMQIRQAHRLYTDVQYFSLRNKILSMSKSFSKPIGRLGHLLLSHLKTFQSQRNVKIQENLCIISTTKPFTGYHKFAKQKRQPWAGRGAPSQDVQQSCSKLLVLEIENNGHRE